jgi:probable HAF family extracellular repeat protein
MKKWLLCPATVLVFALAASDLISAQYSVLDLGPFVGSGLSINNSGHVAGIKNTIGSGFNTNPVFYDGSTFIDIVPPSIDIYEIAGMNNNDVVALNKANGAYVWSSGSGLSSIGTLGGQYNFASAINDNGIIVGRAESDFDDHAFYWDGSMHYLTTNTYHSNAMGINNSGQIAGIVKNSPDPFRAVRLNISGGTQYLGILGTCDLANSMGNDINESGHVVGMSQGSLPDGSNTTPYHAFLWDGAMHDLGALGSSALMLESHANAINASDQVVGISSTNSGAQLAFLYDNGSMKDLNTLDDPDSGWIFWEAFDINDSGQIVGLGTHNGEPAAFILTPIPEPSMLVLLVCAIVGLLGYARAHKA